MPPQCGSQDTSLPLGYKQRWCDHVGMAQTQQGMWHRAWAQKEERLCWAAVLPWSLVWDKSILPGAAVTQRDHSSFPFLSWCGSPPTSSVITFSSPALMMYSQPLAAQERYLPGKGKKHCKSTVREQYYQNAGFEGEAFQGLSQAPEDWRVIRIKL